MAFHVCIFKLTIFRKLTYITAQKQYVHFLIDLSVHTAYLSSTDGHVSHFCHSDQGCSEQKHMVLFVVVLRICSSAFGLKDI